MDIVLKQAESEKEIRISRELFLEYARSLSFNLCFQDFDKELESLPGKYALPSGRLTLCYVDGIPAGCIALRNIDDDTCEMKRLYVKPSYRGLKLGMKLSQHLLDEARKICVWIPYILRWNMHIISTSKWASTKSNHITTIRSRV